MVGVDLVLVAIKHTLGKVIRTEVILTDKGRAVAAQVFRNLRLPATAYHQLRLS